MVLLRGKKQAQKSRVFWASWNRAMRLGAVTKGLRVLFVVRMTHTASQWEKIHTLWVWGGQSSYCYKPLQQYPTLHWGSSHGRPHDPAIWPHNPRATSQPKVPRTVLTLFYLIFETGSHTAKVDLKPCCSQKCLWTPDPKPPPPKC